MFNNNSRGNQAPIRHNQRNNYNANQTPKRAHFSSDLDNAISGLNNRNRNSAFGRGGFNNNNRRRLAPEPMDEDESGQQQSWSGESVFAHRKPIQSSKSNALFAKAFSSASSNESKATLGRKSQPFDNNKPAFGSNTAFASSSAFGQSPFAVENTSPFTNNKTPSTSNTAFASSSAFGQSPFVVDNTSPFTDSKASSTSNTAFASNSAFGKSPFGAENTSPYTDNKTSSTSNSPFASNSAFGQSPFAPKNKSPFTLEKKSSSAHLNKSPFVGGNRSSFGDMNKSSLAGENKSAFTGVKKSSFVGNNKSPFVVVNKPSFAAANKPPHAAANKPPHAAVNKSSFAQRNKSHIGNEKKSSFAPSSTLSKLIPETDDSEDEIVAPHNKAAARAQRFGSTAKSVIYDQYKKSRIAERQEAIDNGLIPDPSNPTRLEDAIDFRGTCDTKCPEFETIEREIQNSLDSLEMDENGAADPDRMVKAYRRSAAGNEQPLPSDVRTPQALISTLDYLLDDVLSSYPLERCHAFIRDRTRSIRQDFTLQNIRDVDAVYVHERIARFHILCLHEMCELEESKFSEQQETEQLRKVLLSLIEFYDDLREEGIETENEAEFRAYYIITHIRDQDVARQAQTLPIKLFKHPLMQQALTFYSLAQRNNEIMETSSRRNKPENSEASMNFFTKFFDLIAERRTPFLMACLLESHFADVRKGALKAMNVSFMMKAGGVPAEDVRKMLRYDTLQQLLQEAHLYGIVLDMSLNDEPTLSFGQRHYVNKSHVFIEPLSNPSQKKSISLVEPKKEGRSFQDIINGEDVIPDTPESTMEDQELPAPIVTTAPTVSEYQQKQVLYEAARAKAEAAAALAAREREKMEALIAKRKQANEQKLLEEQRQKEELERKQAAIEKEQQERQRLIQEEKLRQQERERAVEEMRQRALLSQERNKFVEELINAVIEEEAKVAVIRQLRIQRYLKKYTRPWVERARRKCTERNARAIKKQQAIAFNKFIVTHNPYSRMNDQLKSQKPDHSTPAGIERRVEHCFAAESYTLEEVEQPADGLWRTENFGELISLRVRDRIKFLNKKEPKDEKTEWQLFISTTDTSSVTATWFKSKFGLDDDFHARVDRNTDFDVAIRMVTPDTQIGAKWACDAGAIIFDLPSSNVNKTPEEVKQYWQECRERLDDLTHKIAKYTDTKVPILFTYFEDSTNTKETLSSIPTRLALDSNELISDYHLLIMNPKTIATRIVDEVNWLANRFSS